MSKRPHDETGDAGAHVSSRLSEFIAPVPWNLQDDNSDADVSSNPVLATIRAEHAELRDRVRRVLAASYGGNYVPPPLPPAIPPNAQRPSPGGAPPPPPINAPIPPGYPGNFPQYPTSAPPGETRICFHFRNKGVCKFGNACRFRHLGESHPDAMADRARTGHAARGAGVPPGQAQVKEGVCFAFLLKGETGCRWGDDCRNGYHLAPEDEAARALTVSAANPAPHGCIALKRLTSAVTEAPKELMLRFFAAWGEQMDYVIIGNIWNKLGQQLRDDRDREAWVAANGEVLARLRRRSVEVLPQCGAREMANIVHGAAHVGLAAAELFDAVSAEIVPPPAPTAAAAVHSGGGAPTAQLPLVEAHSHHLLCPLTRRVFVDPVVCAGDNTTYERTAIEKWLADHDSSHLSDAVSSVELVSNHALRGAISALAADDVREIESAAAVCAAEAAGRIRGFNAQDIANTVWAFATARRAAPALFDAMAAAAVRKVGDFNAQNIANTVWAFATARRAAPALFDAMAAVAVRKVNGFNEQDIANTVWAFATARRPAPALFDAMAVAVRKVNGFNAQAIANTVWAFATARRPIATEHRPTKDLFDEMATKAEGLIADFNEQDIANTAWSFAKLQAHHGKNNSFFHKLGDAAAARCEEPKHLAQVALAYAYAGAGTHPTAAELFKKIATTLSVAEDASRVAAECNEQDVATLTWAFAVTNQHHGPNLNFFQALGNTALQRLKDVDSPHFEPVWLAMIVRAQIISGVKLPLELFDEAKKALVKMDRDQITDDVIREIRKELALASRTLLGDAAPTAAPTPQGVGLEALIRFMDGR